jgi:alkylhydroperoxidase family enzyme
MTYFVKTTAPEDAEGSLKEVYERLQAGFGMVPKVFVAQSIRPDLLEAIVNYVNGLMLETRALTRSTKELIAAYVSKLNSCAY